MILLKNKKGTKSFMNHFKNDTNHIFYFILILRPQSTVSSLITKIKKRFGEKSGEGGTPTQSSPTGTLEECMGVVDNIDDDGDAQLCLASLSGISCRTPDGCLQVNTRIWASIFHRMCQSVAVYL